MTLDNSAARRPVAVLLLAASLLCAAMAGLAFRRMSAVETILLPLDRVELHPWRGSVRGSVEAGLPPFRLHWDGRPPKAEVIDLRSGTVVAPRTLARATFESNRRAVLWSQRDDYIQVQERCEILLPPRMWREERAHLALRLEVPPPREPFFRRAGLAALLAVLAGLALRVRKVVRLPAGARLRPLLGTLKGIFYLALALASLLTHFPGSPWLSGDTDNATINSFAAALDRPEAFTRDALLSDPANFTWYTPLYVAAARNFKAMGFSYDVSKAVLGFLGTWIGLLGFDRLFSRVSASRLYGFLGSLSLALLIASYPPDEHWAFSQVRPRTLFTALLPWVLLLALRWRTVPRRWWLATAAAALLFYVHPVSSPALSAALLLGLAVAGQAPLRARAAGVAAAAAVTLAVMAPYTAIWTTKRPQSSGGADLAELASIMPRFVPRTFYADVLQMILGQPRFWLLFAVLVFLAWQTRRSPGRLRRHTDLRFFWGALAGFCLVTFAIPAVDWELAAAAGRLPFQTDLIRGLRYADVFLVVSLGLAVRCARTEERRLATRIGVSWGDQPPLLAGTLRARRTALVGCLLLLACYGGSLATSARDIVIQVGSNLRLLRGRPPEVPLARLELVYALEALRRPGEVVSIPDDLDFLRQLYIPLTYMWKDPLVLSYANPEAMRAAGSALRQARAYLAKPVDATAARQIAEVLGADLIVLERERAALGLYDDPSLLFSNARYLLLRPRALQGNLRAGFREAL